MALCSYVALARFDDCSRPSRTREHLDELRSKQRDHITKTRLFTRIIKMIQNRPSLAQSILSPSDDVDVYDTIECDRTLCEQTPSDSIDLSSQLHVFTDDPWASCQNTPAPSPAWSSSTGWSSASTVWSSSSSFASPDFQIAAKDVPEYFFETLKPNSAASSNRSNIKPVLSHRQPNVIRGNRPSLSPPRRLNSADQHKIRTELAHFKESLCLTRGDPAAINKLIHEHWGNVLNAVQSYDRRSVEEAISMLTSLASDNLLTPESSVYIFQHGLAFSLRDTLWRLQDGHSKIKNLVLSIGLSAPNVVPYMVDLMSHSKIFNDFEDTFDCGDLNELRAALEFYYHLSEILKAQLFSEETAQPFLPEILRLTGVSEQTLESYSPLSTAKKCIRPKLIRYVISNCLERSHQRDEDILNMALIFLANVIKFAQFEHMNSSNENSDWLVGILAAFKAVDIEHHIYELMKALERLVHRSESSEHCSQGVGVGYSAAKTIEQCRLFMDYFHNHYNELTSRFSQELLESNYSVGESSSSIDPWG